MVVTIPMTCLSQIFKSNSCLLILSYELQNNLFTLFLIPSLLNLTC